MCLDSYNTLFTSQSDPKRSVLSPANLHKWLAMCIVKLKTNHKWVTWVVSDREGVNLLKTVYLDKAIILCSIVIPITWFKLKPPQVARHGLYRFDRVFVTNICRPAIVDRVLLIVRKMLADSLNHRRLTVIKDASKDTPGNFSQSGCLFLSQLHKSQSVAVEVISCFLLRVHWDVVWSVDIFCDYVGSRRVNHLPK